MKKKLLSYGIGFLILLVLAACGQTTTSQQEGESDRLKIVTTYSILYDIVKNVSGEEADIYSLVPIGADPHEYDPLPEDVKQTTDADLVFYNGLNLEEGGSWFSRLVETTGKSAEEVFLVSEGVEPIYLESQGLDGEPDPHAWMDVKNGITYTENIRDALVEVNPENEDVYVKNAEDYIQQLEELHNDIQKKMSDIPEEKRFLITSEGAFKYFGAAYQVETGYIWEINSENEGSPQQIRDVIDLIRERDVSALFLETSIDARSMEMVSNETNVPIAGEVYTDSLGNEGTPGDTYMKMMESNANTIFNGLVNDGR
ncbi:metal ABC transporter substrate-binding protein [Shouchella shacheensis]|uniref:metal ABC transporter substrate-binding protein n=1 Tax=Shouchella shacheensis TaxID=1649580 RepID=UPI00074028BC|nr:metal ABC transporter substrate-binding protein [Shouchella shacheensis]